MTNHASNATTGFSDMQKKCVKCEVNRSVEQFFWKTKEKTRRDTVCSLCRADEQRERRKKRKNKTLHSDVHTTGENSHLKNDLICENPTRDSISDSGFIKTPESKTPNVKSDNKKRVTKSKKEKKMDFGLWEKSYGRKLTEEEKMEIEINLTAFFLELSREFSRQTGKFVSLKKEIISES